MRIEGLPLPIQTVLNALSKPDASFRLPGGAAPRMDVAATPPPAPSLQAATSVQVMIAAAALNETPQQIRKREAKRVDRGVSLLERLHQATLGGPPEPQVLEELAQWAEEFSLPDSPQLQSLARDVELRVKVELARHERFV